MVSLLATGDEFAKAHLDRIAESHGRRGLNIEPDLYDLWRKTLIRTVAGTDPAFDETVEQAWRHVLQTAIDYMIAHDRS